MAAGWVRALAALAIVTVVTGVAWGRVAPAEAQPAQPPIIAQLGDWQLADPAFEALPGAMPHWGILGRATFRIEIPNNWNGDLVMYAHGYRGEGKVLTVSNPLTRAYLIQHGYAWAASSYSQNSYAPDVGVTDTLALRAYFSREFGRPRRTFLEGTSMGGHVVVASLEQYPGVYDGALAECGVMMQIQEIDYLLAAGTVADYLSGADALPVASADAYAALVRDVYLPAFGGLENTTQRGRQFESVMKHLTGGSRPWRHQGMVNFNAFERGALTTAPLASLTALARTNSEFRFHIDPGLGLTDEELNAGVKRIVADPRFRNPGTDPTFALPTGRIAVPLMSYHTTGDNFVPLLHQINYRRLVDAADRGHLLVQRTVRAPNHCQFDPLDAAEGFADLAAWVETGSRPDGEDLLAPDLTEIGRRWTHSFLPGDPGVE